MPASASPTATSSRSARHAAGLAAITVTNPQGTSSAANAPEFDYLLAPAVSGVSPWNNPHAAAASGGTSGGYVEISGSNFTDVTAVYFGTNAAASTFGANGNSPVYLQLSDSNIVVLSPPGNAGTVDVTVATPGGTSTISSADSFTYVCGACGRRDHGADSRCRSRGGRNRGDDHRHGPGRGHRGRLRPQ